MLYKNGYSYGTQYRNLDVVCCLGLVYLTQTSVNWVEETGFRKMLPLDEHRGKSVEHVFINNYVGGLSPPRAVLLLGDGSGLQKKAG